MAQACVIRAKQFGVVPQKHSQIISAQKATTFFIQYELFDEK
jgi:hypothetical protein